MIVELLSTAQASIGLKLAYKRLIAVITVSLEELDIFY